MPHRQQSDVRQALGGGRARYVEMAILTDQPEVCRHCGSDIVFIDGRWSRLEADWPNLAHCHYSAGDGSSVGHTPED